ncbi:MAG: tRNA pseudouridine(55) synthase TruB [Bacteroidales bacterium]|nr:tRNA pseudouridine(55) synthase TruB [Bacteroidales bacterium]
MTEQTQAESYINGKTLLIDKELDWTSFDVVNKIRVSLRNELGIKKIKVGHAGTLDPLATGLVIICTGRSTKMISQYTGLDKEYVATVTLGATTPSFDLETEINQRLPFKHLTKEMIREELKGFLGTIEQVPPIFSAKQIDGKRAYNLARQGEDVKMRKNTVTIHEIEMIEYDPPGLKLRICCSKGTYIRSIADDLGKKLKCGAHLSSLRRTRIGEFHVNDAEKINDFVKKLKPL